jgi:hypothetical protein
VGSHTVPGGAAFDIKRVIVDTKLAQPTRVRAIALKQGDRRVVRHAVFYDAATGRWLGAWTPWQTISRFGSDVAIRLPANARLAVEIGYTGTDQDVTDASEIGLYFDDGNGAAAGALHLTAPRTVVAAHASAERTRAESTLAADTDVLAFWLEPGDGAQSVEISAFTPDGMSTPLLWINEFRPEWRSPYLLESPVTLPRGTRVVMTTYVANSLDEKRITQPAAWVITVPAVHRGAAPQK